ncbi:hypothetical protein K491DRAFT_674312 [Lophiostoma macrostomum CBS 122681]|uniref:Uncharacterized protein n=1 Tax=Lophiostoma macrostomum CBS 122681 TaxID=1314788 RepID=A0A6A6TQ28_9PLEO|nr:hypothetical protein K491DRAFT_674312 [Lophiostoma macrostomum CBS 122681]
MAGFRDSQIPKPSVRGRAAPRSPTVGSRSSGSGTGPLLTPASSNASSNQDNETKLGLAHQRIAELELQLNIARIGQDDDAPTKKKLERDLELTNRQSEMWRKKWVAVDKKLKEVQSVDTNQDVKIKQLERAIRELQASESALQQQASQVPGLETRLQQLDAMKVKAEERLSLAELDAEAKVEALEICETTHKKLTERNAFLEESCTELEGQVSALREQLALINNSYEAKVIDLNHERNDLATKLKEANQARSAAETQLTQAVTVQPMLAVDEEKEALTSQVERLTAQLGAAQAHESYVQALEHQNETLDDQLADAVSESREKEVVISQFQAQYRGLEAKIKELEVCRSTAQSSGYDVGGKGGLRCTNLAPGDISEPDTPVTPANPIDDAEIEACVEAATAAAVAKALASHASLPSTPVVAPAPTPAPIAITITIDPSDRTNWTWLQKTKAAVGKYTAIGYEGPVERVAELQKQMKLHVAVFEGMRKEVKRLENRPKCVELAHKDVRDTIAAKESQIEMQQQLLLDYGRRIREMAC